MTKDIITETKKLVEILLDKKIDLSEIRNDFKKMKLEEPMIHFSEHLGKIPLAESNLDSSNALDEAIKELIS